MKDKLIEKIDRGIYEKYEKAQRNRLIQQRIKLLKEMYCEKFMDELIDHIRGDGFDPNKNVWIQKYKEEFDKIIKET